MYEVQLLKQFMEFLINGPLPAGYTAASRAWVSEVLISFPDAQGNTHAHAAPGWVESCLFFQMTHGTGGNHNKAGLALAYGKMNSRKETLFEGGTPDSRPRQSNLKSRQEHRDVYGVFSYMGRADIWPKFQASSQFMEQACREFDQSYAWGSFQGGAELGRPARPGTNPPQPEPGLRDLYAYWIDRVLADIEARARAWYDATVPAYTQSYGSDNDGRKWLANVLNTQGQISPTGLRFPRAGARHGTTGLWAQSNYENLWLTGPGYGAAGPF